MLKLPGNLDAEQFLARHWQKKPLLMPQAVDKLRPAVTRNELAWLATLDDVESRIVFTDRSHDRVRYRAETGPFDEEFLAALPARDWTLLVHDVEKHLPTMRRLFDLIPFIPDWRIDDLMVSFAAPGGGVGPHRDNYDVFLCQGIGVREWHVTSDDVANDPHASDDLALTTEFTGEISHECRNGDVLYLPPGVAHWGTAHRACLTYSIGMRAPQVSDLAETLPDAERDDVFYTDENLQAGEARPGYISEIAAHRAVQVSGAGDSGLEQMTQALGRFATETKQWITPVSPDKSELGEIVAALEAGKTLRIHGMTRIAWSDDAVFVNGGSTERPPGSRQVLENLCAQRKLQLPSDAAPAWHGMAAWMAKRGAFEYVK
ncbi:MAG: cupin domain-containing protein [Woeseiaceae bacterium]|nr:cupin domain-containing protein [Woeseiaceae bacterium]